MVNVTVQRRIASQILKCSPKKITFDVTRLNDIKESITTGDIKALIAQGLIKKRIVNHASRGGARKILAQKKKGLQKGHGSRKGKASARTNPKDVWVAKIRKIRSFLKSARDSELISITNYHSLTDKAKGGFFRSFRHVKVYMTEHNMFQKSVQKK